MSVLVVAEHLRGELRDVTRELVTAAQELEGPVTLAVIAREPARIDAGIAGVDEIVQVDVEADEFENDVYQEAVEALIRERKPDVVLLGFTVNAMGYARRGRREARPRLRERRPSGCGSRTASSSPPAPSTARR